MKLKVIFDTDSTGKTPPTNEEIIIPCETCLFCLHDKSHNNERFYGEIIKSLEYKGYDPKSMSYFQLLKVYTI